MAINHYGNVRYWLLGLAVSVTLSILGVMILAPKLEYRLPTDQILAEQGKAFIVGVPSKTEGIFRITGDWTDGSRSSLTLFENGVALAPRQAHHDVIRAEGGGAYNHWGNNLWFSVPDGTDPRSNGRTYSVEAKSFLPFWYFAGALASLCAVCALFFREQTLYYFTPAASFGVDLLRSGITPIRALSGGAALGFAVIAIAAAVSLTFFLWWGPFSQGLHIGGYLPVSDAMGWQTCGTTLAATGDLIHPVWCSRRVLHPSLLATVLVTGSWYGQVALILLAAVAGLAILSLSFECARRFGRLPAIIATGTLGVYAWEYVLAQFMTAITGFSLGITGLALLLRYTEDKKYAWLLFGITLISIGLTARAGALLVLPALFVWGLYVSGRGSPRRSLRLSLPIAMAVASGPIMQFFVLIVLGLDTTNSGGNFSVSLYGLSTGSREWSEAYRDFPELFILGEAEAFKQIYGIALGNIRNSPTVFLASLYEAGLAYVSTLFSFGVSGSLNKWLSAFLVVGLVECVRRFRSSLVCSLLLTLAVAELASAPLVFDSGGHRVFAASIGIRIVLAVFGISVLIGWLTKRGKTGISVDSPSDSKPPILPLALGVSIVAAILFPISPLANLFRLDPVSGIGCPEGRMEIVARLGRESQTLGIVSTKNEESVIPYRLTRERLVADEGMQITWFAKDVLDLPAKSTIIRAFQRRRQEFGTFFYLLWAGEEPETGEEGLVSICVDHSRSFVLASVPHFLAVSMTPLSRNSDE